MMITVGLLICTLLVLSALCPHLSFFLRYDECRRQTITSLIAFLPSNAPPFSSLFPSQPPLLLLTHTLCVPLESYAVSSRNSWQLIPGWNRLWECVHTCGLLSAARFGDACPPISAHAFTLACVCTDKSWHYYGDLNDIFARHLLLPFSPAICSGCTSTHPGRIRAIRWLLLTVNYSGPAEAAAVINPLPCCGSLMKCIKQYSSTLNKLH